MTRSPVLELAVQSLAGVRVAAEVGAARVELCVALGATGGLTPSIGLLGAVVETAAAVARESGAAHAVEVHPLIRPRAGGFVYDAAEIDIQVRDVRAAVEAGARGVVVGALTASGTVDASAIEALVAAADGREVTFHRAIDAVADPLLALDVLCELGVTRVLTSGGAQRSIDGIDRLRAMVARVDGRLQVMAGGGVRPVDVAALLGAGIDAVHLSAKRFVTDAAGVGGGSDAGYEVTDPSVAREASDALSAAGSCG
ncbi:copper homeostasis protein [Sanguibacter gelidistatuariae]|uniref:PF03932 family protein CutC n=1 Tax=Sanguibacter gelidistatuariae TaxID=1814289 RepID=A0A1G6HGD5_9MICO|nr:copper homeostasis protein CutC [Sanguibacter gelidistatuariae]SDB92506.1 copper homeostasis protein [Sanguibacter gelidistatuariae]